MGHSCWPTGGSGLGWCRYCGWAPLCSRASCAATAPRRGGAAPIRSLAAAPGEQPPVGGSVVAQPVDVRRYVPPGRCRYLPAPPGNGRLIVVPFAFLAIRRMRLRLDRRTFEDRQDRVEPLSPHESGWPTVDKPYLNRFRSDPAHCSPACASQRSGRATVRRPGTVAGPSRAPQAPLRTPRSVGYPGEDRQLRLVRNYIRSKIKARANRGNGFR